MSWGNSKTFSLYIVNTESVEVPIIVSAWTQDIPLGVLLSYFLIRIFIPAMPLTQQRLEMCWSKPAPKKKEAAPLQTPVAAAVFEKLQMLGRLECEYSNIYICPRTKVVAHRVNGPFCGITRALKSTAWPTYKKTNAFCSSSIDIGIKFHDEMDGYTRDQTEARKETLSGWSRGMVDYIENYLGWKLLLSEVKVWDAEKRMYTMIDAVATERNPRNLILISYKTGHDNGWDRSPQKMHERTYLYGTQASPQNQAWLQLGIEKEMAHLSRGVKFDRSVVFLINERGIIMESQPDVSLQGYKYWENTYLALKNLTKPPARAVAIQKTIEKNAKGAKTAKGRSGLAVCGPVDIAATGTRAIRNPS
jgi:hypothetical protein